jgi:hypothetical protein
MDDVETIEKFGVDETFIFLADSAKRDKAAYPTAAEYEVLFNSQFRNVVKFEVLKVNIPRTDYLVDETESTFSYSIDQPTNINTWQTQVQGNIRTANITPGDYNLPQLIDELNNALQQVSNAFGDTVTLRTSPTTNPSEISNKINITGSGPFTLLGDESTIRSTLGFGDPVNTNQATSTGYYATVPGYTINFPNGAANVFLSVPGDIPGAQNINIFVGPFPPGDNTSFVPIYTGQVLRQYFTAPSAGVPSAVTGYFRDIATAPPGGFVSNVAIKRVSDNSTIAFGNINSINDDLTSSVTNGLTVSNNFVQGVDYYVEFTPGAPGTSNVNCTSLWYTFPNLPPVPGAFMSVNGNTVAYTGDYFSTTVTAGAIGNNLTSPGIVNLRGARYIKIRCKELEQLIYKDRVGEPSTAGVGVVNIVGYGYAESRYDFSSIPVKPFHPIGKLQKLTFRLERPDGTLYATNGVDNTLLCALTFRTVPNNSVNKTFDGPGKYPGNPAYTGDYIQVQQNRWAQEAKATYETQKSTYDRCRPRT